MKKLFLIPFIFLIMEGLFCSNFDEKNIVPFLGVGGGATFHESVQTGKFYVKETYVGPTIGLDSIFSMKKNGFTLMADGLIYALFVDKCNADPYSENKTLARNMGFGIVGWIELLFGYTYGIDEKFQFTAAIGPGFFFLLAPGLNLKLNATYFISDKCGIYFSLGNSFLFGNKAFYGKDNKWILSNITTFSIGPVFKLK